MRIISTLAAALILAAAPGLCQEERGLDELEREAQDGGAAVSPAPPAQAKPVAAAGEDYRLEKLDEKLAKGPVSFECHEILIDAPGGSDHLKFKLARDGSGGDLKFSEVDMGIKGSGRPPQPVEWTLRFACDDRNYSKAALYGYCSGKSARTDSGAAASDGGIFISRDFKSGALFAKIFWGKGPKSEGGTDRSVLICKISG